MVKTVDIASILIRINNTAATPLISYNRRLKQCPNYHLSVSTGAFYGTSKEKLHLRTGAQKAITYTTEGDEARWFIANDFLQFAAVIAAIKKNTRK